MARHTPAGPGRSRASRGRGSSRKRDRDDDEELPDVYQEMLQEAETRDPAQFSSDRPIKRRKAGDINAIPVEQEHIRAEDDDQPIQTIYDSSTADESDVEWEDVDITQHTDSLPSTVSAAHGGEDTLQITFDQGSHKPKKTIQRRKPVSGAERKIRLDIHKVHILCLLGHVHLRNLWCNDRELQGFLSKMLPRNVKILLHPSEDKAQYLRSTTFMDGLNQAGDIFSRRFGVTKPGLKRAHWAESQDQLKQKLESIMSDAEVFLSKADYVSQAKTLQGSRDFGAQLFCALLRSAGVEARLVCSLQPLPFSGTVKDMTPVKTDRKYIVISSDDHETSTDEHNHSSNSPTPSRARRIGQPQFTPSRPFQSSSRSGPRPNLRESSYPVFWVEAFNEAVQKWFPIDPIVTKSLAKAVKFEPPASDPYNFMSYVVAFDDDASVVDVTQRYTKAYNAKTRKLRVESTRHGDRWWQKALNAYEKPFLLDRDEAEISELTSKSAAEPMPRNIQDFKDHPIYALERHLRRNEVIHPKRVIGHVGLSKPTSNSDHLDTVYRRSDVHIVRSADKWYRLGRDIRVGEQPLKRVPASRSKVGILSDEDDTEPEETALYAGFQTEIYKPPPVVQGKIPKNAYGNLDIYVPSMVPPGAVHIRRPEAARAARILGVDYADAVTGFDFRGRRGTAVLQGVIIATEYQEALNEVLRSIEDERLHAAFEARSAESLRLWRLFLAKLRIAERVKAYAGDDDARSDMSIDVEADEAGGGFIPEPGQQLDSRPLVLLGGKNLAQRAVSPIPETENGPAFASSKNYEFPGGSIPGGPVDQDSTTASATPTTSLPAGLQRNWGTRRPPIPRYQLVVVPNDSVNDSGNSRPGIIFGNLPTTPAAAEPRYPEGSSEKAPITVDSSNEGSKSASVELVSKPASPVPQRQSPVPMDQDSDSEIEKGSLMSEDPEDEDAIPEWLV
ncbi:hypothetical protein N7510_006195 [Penicillium lagena]|uniref:uncharacterized protein n=1 Tax=Penicillium lagena TaxID=94218 RepID=UPI0025411551|nr:uncharacterized protein N7510_006195 [Penicillium lagena]KAJ5613001.1 hypothetical protein N7510_006195 [Penicillium lagena]